MVSKWPKYEVFCTDLKIGPDDFSKILTKHASLWILIIFQKLAQNNDFSRSYDVKRGKKKRQKNDFKTKKKNCFRNLRLWVVLIILGSGAYFFLSNLRLGGAYKSGAYKKNMYLNRCITDPRNRVKKVYRLYTGIPAAYQYTGCIPVYLLHTLGVRTFCPN